MSGRFSQDILLKLRPLSSRQGPVAVAPPTTDDVYEEDQSMRNFLPSVIIFCNDYNKYHRLVAVKCYSVIDVCTDHETLKQCILRELPSLKFNLFSNQKLLYTRPLPSAQGSVENNVYFSHALFVDLLKQRGKHKKGEKDVMLNKCRDYYRRNGRQLEKIEAFRRTYSPSQAINWYTEECFLYRLVNRAFRTEDIAP